MTTAPPVPADGPILVTGGAGFIGSHLVQALLRSGRRVRVIDNLTTGAEENLAAVRHEIDFVRGDIRSAETCLSAVSGARAVVHLAALGSVPRSMKDPATTIEVNVTGTANVFAAARAAGASRVVYASSSSVYGDSASLPKREGEEGRPLSPYALSKVMNEDLADVFTRCFGMQFVGLRFFNVFGPRQSPEGPYAAVVPRWMDSLRGGRAPVIFGDGEQSRDFTFVSDAVRAVLLALETPAGSCGAAYNVAGGRRVTLNELATALGDVSGRRIPPVHQTPREGDIRHSLADLSLVRNRLGYVPGVSLVEGLGVAWEAATGSSR